VRGEPRAVAHRQFGRSGGGHALSLSRLATRLVRRFRAKVSTDTTPTARRGPALTPAEAARRRQRVAAYLAGARRSCGEAAEARRRWLADMNAVYAAIPTSPVPRTLDRAGQVGRRHEPALREALAGARALPAPPEAEAVHAALLAWVSALYGACLALSNVHSGRDRDGLRMLRERLGEARQHSAALAAGWCDLVAKYGLRDRAVVRAARVGFVPAPPDADRRQQGVRAHPPGAGG